MKPVTCMLCCPMPLQVSKLSSASHSSSSSTSSLQQFNYNSKQRYCCWTNPISKMMTLYLSSPPWLSRPSPPIPTCNNSNTNPLLFRLSFTSFNSTKLITKKVSSLGDKESGNEIAEDSVSELLNEDLLSKVSSARDAQEALKIVCDEMNERRNGVAVRVSDCCSIISAALKRNNSELALSVFYEMRASFDQGIDENGPKWRWSRPDVEK